MLMDLGTATASWLGHLLGKAGQWLGAPPPDRYERITEYRSNPILARMGLSGIVFGNVVLYSVADPAIRVPLRQAGLCRAQGTRMGVAQYGDGAVLGQIPRGEIARPFSVSRVNRYEGRPTTPLPEVGLECANDDRVRYGARDS